MNIAEWLAATARLRPNAPALLTGFDLDADYATFARRAAAIGAVLARDYAVAPGDRVGLFATNCTQYLECLYGIWWIGAVAIPINAKLHGREARGFWAMPAPGSCLCPTTRPRRWLKPKAIFLPR